MTILNYCLDAILNTGKMILTGVLPWLATAGLMQVISSALRRKLACLLGTGLWVYLTAPGVMIHELSHAFFCLVFRHRIVEMKLFSPEEDGTLGYVNHSYNPQSLFQRCGNFFIGTGPIWGGTALLAVLSYFLLPGEMTRYNSASEEQFGEFISGLFSVAFWTSWTSWLWLYLTLTICSHITLSCSDLRGAVDGFGMLCGVFLLANVLLDWCGNWPQIINGLSLSIFGMLLPIFGVISIFMLVMTAIIHGFARR